MAEDKCSGVSVESIEYTNIISIIIIVISLLVSGFVLTSQLPTGWGSLPFCLFSVSGSLGWSGSWEVIQIKGGQCFAAKNILDENPISAKLITAKSLARGTAMTAQSKPWYASKTIWLNVVTASVAVLTALQGQAIVQDHPSLAAGLVAALGVANVALRIITILPVG